MTGKLDVGECFRKYSNSLRTRYDLTASATGHSLSKGLRREDIFQSYLSENLPEVVGVSQGHIIDSEWNLSRECDLILYSRLSLCFKNPDVRLFPADSVLAALEVKSYLNKDAIHDSIDKTRVIKRMPVEAARVVYGGMKEWIVGCIAAFESDSIETVNSTIMNAYLEKSVAEREQVDLIYIHNKAIGIRQPKALGLRIKQPENPEDPDLSDKKLVWMESGDDSLLVFTILLAHVINNPLNMTRDYFKYISKFDFRTVSWEE